MKALVFDTIASNTGWNNSAAKCLEKLLDKSFFTTRVVHEFIIGAVYTCLFGDSSAPDEANFNFQAEWTKIDLSKDCHILEMSSQWLKEKSKLVVCELQQIIKRKKQRKKLL